MDLILGVGIGAFFIIATMLIIDSNSKVTKLEREIENMKKNIYITNKEIRTLARKVNDDK